MIRILAVPILAFACVAARSKSPLSSTTLDWELVPAGYLEPRSKGPLDLDALAERFTDQELADATRHKDQAAMAYVVLLRKKGLARVLPARKELDKVDAIYGALRIRVQYERSRNGFEKVIAYPAMDKAHESIIQQAQQLAIAQTEKLAQEPIASDDTEEDDATGPFLVKVGQQGMFPYIYVLNKDRALCVRKRSLSDATRRHRTLAAGMATRDDWKGIHVLLTQTFYPQAEWIGGTSAGYDIDYNGLSVQVLKSENKWDLAFPDEARERSQLCEYWSLRLSKQPDCDLAW